MCEGMLVVVCCYRQLISILTVYKQLEQAPRPPALQQVVLICVCTQNVSQCEGVGEAQWSAMAWRQFAYIELEEWHAIGSSSHERQSAT